MLFVGRVLGQDTGNGSQAILETIHIRNNVHILEHVTVVLCLSLSVRTRMCFESVQRLESQQIVARLCVTCKGFQMPVALLLMVPYRCKGTRRFLHAAAASSAICLVEDKMANEQRMTKCISCTKGGPIDIEESILTLVFYPIDRQRCA